MSPQKTWPRSKDQHENTAVQVLQKFERLTGKSASLPIPISEIIEIVYNLSILCEAIDEPPGQVILGALSPPVRIIRLNERHLDDIFDAYIGPENFTLAHELGHWIYDADSPDQGQLFESEMVFCYRSDEGVANSWDIREINANKFAACLVLPEHLMRAAIKEPFKSWNALSSLATTWCVSKTTLKIRLETLNMEWALP